MHIINTHSQNTHQVRRTRKVEFYDTHLVVDAHFRNAYLVDTQIKNARLKWSSDSKNVFLFFVFFANFCLKMNLCDVINQVSGGFWYVLSIQRIAECLKKQCYESQQCHTLALTCPREICYSSYTRSCVDNSSMKADFSTCMDQNGDFPYGLYAFALPLIIKNSNIIKILFANLWGLMSIRYQNNTYIVFINIVLLVLKL